jgi:hypothetical protein
MLGTKENGKHPPPPPKNLKVKALWVDQQFFHWRNFRQNF